MALLSLVYQVKIKLHVKTKQELNLVDRMLGDERDSEIEKVPEPEGMVVYDPDHPLYEQRHVCFLLRKVSDALHGYQEEESEGEY